MQVPSGSIYTALAFVSVNTTTCMSCCYVRATRLPTLIKGATVKAGMQERGTEGGAEIRCKVRPKMNAHAHIVKEHMPRTQAPHDAEPGHEASCRRNHR